MTVYDNDEAVRALTIALLKHMRVFQIHRLDSDEATHVNKLLAFFDPPVNATVLDLGCGVGTVAAMMKETRPDLDFVLLNRSAAQLALCPPGFRKVQASFESLPLDLPPVDAAMILYALGHGDLYRVFSGAARVLSKGGVLLVYDLVCDVGRADALRATLEYAAYPTNEINVAAARHGFCCYDTVAPETSVDHFLPLFPQPQFDAVFKDVYPRLFRFVKC